MPQAVDPHKGRRHTNRPSSRPPLPPNLLLFRDLPSYKAALEPELETELTLPLPDRGETLMAVEPLLPEESSRHRPKLEDLVIELVAASAALRGAIPDGMHPALADAVRAMNCYYSNLIEGHHTHPIDIERALAGDFSAEPEKRDLQLEARAHIDVQAWIDHGGLHQHPMHPDAIRDIHARFCAGLPADLLRIETPDGPALLTPGALRSSDVRVGRHVALSPGAVPRLLTHMHSAYARPGRLSSVIGIACAHHRLAWVHPFPDLNGRVTRMVSHALLLDHVGSAGLWSVSRGLARNEQDYKRRLMAADEPRHGGADGRGALSEQRLAEFAEYFLGTCLDQVRFMGDLMQPARLRERILNWGHNAVQSGTLPPGSELVLREALYLGTLDRAALPALLNVGERQARKVSSALLATGALASASTRAPLRLNFSPRLAPYWMPGLFPDR